MSDHSPKVVFSIFQVLGIVLTLVLLFGVFVDLMTFDQTKGGHTAPYDDVLGEPVDFEALDETPSGLVHRGMVADIHLDCTTGMLTFEILGMDKVFRKVSDRELHVHKPRTACLEHGFIPKF